MYSKILAALDGSPHALAAARVALEVARRVGAELLVCHVYDAGVHTGRFRDMEPGLPEEYQDEDGLARLRGSHGSLISEGFQALSRGYMETFVAQARGAGVAVSEAIEEGRNFMALLEAIRRTDAGLVALGAYGLGHAGDGMLGSTAARVLRGARCDVLLARDGQPAEGPVLVGIDGSQPALDALGRGAAWAEKLERELYIAAAYDPDFHTEIFRTMARSLSPERQAEVGLDKQEGLHHRFIDEGLRTLYQGFLDAAAEGLGGACRTMLLRGKAYSVLADCAKQAGAGLIAVGRVGHHANESADIGSNAEAIARVAPCPVLIVQTDVPEPAAPEGEMAWDADAEDRLKNIPAFARGMARQGIERQVREKGGTRVTLDDVLEVGRRLGMTSDGAASDG